MARLKFVPNDRIKDVTKGETLCEHPECGHPRNRHAHPPKSHRVIRCLVCRCPQFLVTAK